MPRSRVPLAIGVIVLAVVLALVCVAVGEPGAAAFALLLAVPPGLFLLGERR